MTWDQRFDTRLPTPEQQSVIRKVRESFKFNAKMLEDYLPEGEYKKLTLIALESASFWAIKAVTHGDLVDDKNNHT